MQVTGCPACLEPGGGFTPPHVHGVVHGRRFRFCYCTRRICACRLDCHTDKRPGCIEAVGMVRYQQFSAVIVILCEELRYAHIIRALPGTWSHRPDLNGQPADYKTAALPVELQWHVVCSQGQRHLHRRPIATHGGDGKEGGIEDFSSIPPFSHMYLALGRSLSKIHQTIVRCYKLDKFSMPFTCCILMTWYSQRSSR